MPQINKADHQLQKAQFANLKLALVVVLVLQSEGRYYLILQHRLNDLRIFEPIAQMLFHSTLKTNYKLNAALRQNHSMSRCGYLMLWSINRNSKALIS